MNMLISGAGAAPCVDMWDPNTWEPDEHVYKIYGSWDVDDGPFAIVDRDDYAWACQYLWSVHDKKKLNHPYLHRKVTVTTGPEGARYESPITGKMVRNRQRVQYTEFLHQAIMRRSLKPQPSFLHREVDHINRKVWDCRRENLRWATRKEQMNNQCRTL